ncbi:MAG: hypothetical protein AB7E47_02905 [Desulfovibrionaceae bacterium]
MANGDKWRTMSYLRASFANTKAHSLYEYVATALRKKKTVADRTVEIDGQEVKCCHERKAKAQDTKNPRLYLHISVSTPGEAVSLVPKEGKNPEVDLGTATAPKGTDFMDGDLMLFIEGNHVLFCSTGLRVGKAKEYLMRLFEEADQPEDALAFSLVSVADVDKIKLIRERGVKRLHLNAGLYVATQEHEEREGRTVTQKVVKAVTNEILALFEEDDDFKEYADAENLTAEVVIKFDRRVKGGELGQERLEKLAQMAVDDGDEGFKIITNDDEKISSTSITLRKYVRVPQHGKTVKHAVVWAEMRSYMGELREQGLLAQ